MSSTSGVGPRSKPASLSSSAANSPRLKGKAGPLLPRHSSMGAFETDNPLLRGPGGKASPAKSPALMSKRSSTTSLAALPELELDSRRQD